MEGEGRVAERAMFAALKPAPANAVFEILTRFRADTHVDVKIDCGVGAFRGPDGQPKPLDVVIEAERRILKLREEGKINHEYPPIGGSQEFVKHSACLALGDESSAITEHRVEGIQALSGTGSLRVVAEFVARTSVDGTPRESKCPVYVPTPTWPNHNAIFNNSGADVRPYRYYDKATKSLDFDGMSQDIAAAPEFSAVILHACAHNPTGVDPSREQWENIANICLERKLIVIFDSAYLGFASGGVDEDAYALRLFNAMGVEFFICMSYSKNMGLYDERAGAALYVARTTEAAHAVNTHIKTLSRALWSVPPQHGARIVNCILGDAELTRKWKLEVHAMATRILETRQDLFSDLSELVPERNWDHIRNQKGMFTFTGLSKKVCDALMDNHHIYLMRSGRISISGIPAGRTRYFAECVAAALQEAENE